MTEAARYQLVAVLIGLGAVCVLYWLISSAVASGVKSGNRRKRRFDGSFVDDDASPPPHQASPALSDVARGFPVIHEPAVMKFKIDGVDRATKLETTFHCEATSEANALAKAELEGIVVTRIDRVG